MVLNLNKNLKLYYSIGEVAKMFNINESTLRYWEKEFPMIQPKKAGGNIRQYRKEDYAIVERSLIRADAGQLRDQNMTELSGGQRQRVYLAMALAQDTGAVLMDEPTTYLDARHQLEVMTMARSLAHEGKTVVLVLHDLTMALRTADVVAVLGDGSIRCVGTPDEVFQAGILDEVFGVTLKRVMTENGWQYYYL